MKIRKNPFFYLSVFLTGILVWQVVSLVQAQTYTGPTVPPTGGMPAAPLHVGIAPQVKKGNFAVSATGVLDGSGNVSSGIQFNAGSPTIWFRDTAGAARLYYVPVNGGELWVQHGTSQGIKIGAGSGTGTSQWQDVAGGISYTGGTVHMGGTVTIAAAPSQPGQKYYNLVSDIAVTNVPSAGELTACGTSDNLQIIDCPNNVYGPTNEPVNATRYDYYKNSNDFYYVCPDGSITFELINCRDGSTPQRLNRTWVRTFKVQQQATTPPSADLNLTNGSIYLDNGGLIVNKSAYIFGSANIKDVYLSSASQGGRGISVTATQTFLITGGCEKKGGVCAGSSPSFGNMSNSSCPNGFSRRDMGVIYLCTFP